MNDWWPAVEPGILGHLQRIFVTPLRLDAAFDSDEECLQMLTEEFPDMVGEDISWTSLRNCPSGRSQWLGL